MLKYIGIVLAGLLACAPVATSSAWAHGNHGAHFDEAGAIDLASRYLVSMVKNKTPIEGKALDQSWLKVPASEMKVVKQASWYYVVAVRNASAKKKLFMLISTKGKLYRANFSGKFPGFE